METKVSLILLLFLNGGLCTNEKRLLIGDTDYVDSKINSLRSEFEAKIQMMNNTIHKLEKEAQESHQQVAFYATLTSNHALGQEQTLIFNKIRTNFGNGYNGISGVFTVPISGVYHFSTTMFRASSGEVHTQMMLNAAEIGRNYGNAQASSGTINVLVSAKKGDTVFIRHMPGLSSQTVYGGGYSSFSGFMVG